MTIKKIYQKFLKSHDYFRKIWLELSLENCKVLIEIIPSGKGLISEDKEIVFIWVNKKTTFLKNTNFLLSLRIKGFKFRIRRC